MYVIHLTSLTSSEPNDVAMSDSITPPIPYDKSAITISKSVRPSVAQSVSGIDRYIRLALDVSGPRYEHVSKVVDSDKYRRSGNAYYTKEMAEYLIREIVCEKGQYRSVLTR